jgi:hypothetical protein
MSFPNPDNYARDCDCGTAGANTTPPPATIQAEIDSLDTRVTALEETNDVIVSSGGIANLTTAQQALIREGSIVVTTDGKRWVYSGAGSKVLEASYIQLADTTPVSPLIFENGGTITMTNNDGTGGSIDMSGGSSGDGGSINTSAGANGNGGSINTSNGGGSINISGAEAGSFTSTGNEGGSINLSTYGGSINLSGNSSQPNYGGGINTSAVDGANGGSINTSGGAAGAGGSINLSNNGGSIDTSDGGGSINTRTGSIELGVLGINRTYLNSSSTFNRTVDLPNVTGTLPVALITTSIPINFNSIAAGGFLDNTSAFTGAAIGDVIFVTCLDTGGRGATDGKLIFEAFVPSSNAVTIRAHNPTSGSIDPASYNFKAAIIKTA